MMWADDNVVITGISGRFPECDSVQEFQEKLMAGVDMISDEPRRFQKGLYGALTKYGMLKDLSRFDASYFNIHHKQVERMDPQIRMLLEVVHETIIDAGLHPDDLSGTRTGVIVGVASSETQDKWSQQPDRINGYEYTGCTRTMFANRISYKYNLKGPSYSIDTASSTTLVAFQQAYDLIKNGVCENCFVCGTDLILNPCVCLMFQCLNMLSPDGKCKAFDESGNGYVRSEGIVAILLQKWKNAKRVYAKVLGAGSNCDGYKDDGITFPSGPQQVVLYKKVAESAKIDPTTVDYVEAHGSATRVGDPQEMNAVTKVFLNGRSTPLKTGSVKSNMGHAEPASALSGIIKVCIMMESGIIPPNLHYNVPNQDIPALLDGRLKVITEPTPWDGGIVAINSFGVGGANGHALLESNKKRKVQRQPDDIPRIVYASGVTEIAVNNMLTKITALPYDSELYALLYNIYRKNIVGHFYRGYATLHNSKIIVTKVEQPRKSRDVVFIFSGIGGQWNEMGLYLTQIGAFKECFENCQLILQKINKKFNLRNVFKCAETDIFSAVVSSTVLQVCTVEILSCLSIEPDYVLGLNVGEIISGYVAASYSLETTLLISYYVASALRQVSGVLGMTILIGESAFTDKYDIPENVIVFSSVSPRCTLVSGPKDSIQKFMLVLKSKNVPVREVNTCGTDLAMLRCKEIFQKLDQDIRKVMENTAKPSQAWIGYSAAAEQDTNLDIASYILKSVTSQNFEEAIEKLRNGSVVIEIGPDASLESVFEPVKKYGFCYINLLSKRSCISQFIDSLGRLYNAGLQPQFQSLYPKIEFPVSHGTPKLQSLIEWDHSIKWDVVTFAAKEGATAGEVKIVTDFDREEYSCLLDNVLNGEQVFPKSFYLYLVMKALSRLQCKPLKNVSVVIENMCFMKDVAIVGKENTEFYVNILSFSGKFEIWEKNDVVAFGVVRLTSSEQHSGILKAECRQRSTICVKKEDIYRDLTAKGYYYNSIFQGLQSYDIEDKVATTERIGNLAIFLELMLQVIILETSMFNSFATMKSIKRVTVNPALCLRHAATGAKIRWNKDFNMMDAVGVEMQGVELAYSATKLSPHPRLEYLVFVPFFGESVPNATELSLHLSLHNQKGKQELKIAEFVFGHDVKQCVVSKLSHIVRDLQAEITLYSHNVDLFERELDSSDISITIKDLNTAKIKTDAHVVICSNASEVNQIELASQYLANDGVLLVEMNNYAEIAIEGLTQFAVLKSDSGEGIHILFKKVKQHKNALLKDFKVVYIEENDMKWIQEIMEMRRPQEAKILLVGKSLSQTFSVINLAQNLSAKHPRADIRTVLIDKGGPDFSFQNCIFEEQIKNFLVSVYKNGSWGTYLALPVPVNGTVETEHAFIGKIDVSTTVDFIQDVPLDEKKQLSDASCDVYYAAVNKPDALLAFNDTYANPLYFYDGTQEVKLGVEFSGVDTEGNRIFGLLPSGGLATSAILDKNCTWNIPEQWSLEEAASVPLAYALAYYGLGIVADINKWEQLLIFGLNPLVVALINIALHRNKTIFVVMESQQQVQYLKDLHLEVPEDNIIVSTNDSFYVSLLEKTNNRGVHVAFNTVKTVGHVLQSFVNCLCQHGSLIYMEDVIGIENALGSPHSLKNITATPISMKTLLNDESRSIMLQISQMMKEGLKSGEIKLLPTEIFEKEHVSDAFKHTLSSKCVVGKAVVKMKKTGTKELYAASPRTYFSSKKSYIVLEGSSKFGLYVTNWMVTRGAKNLVLVSQNDTNDTLQNLYSKRWVLQKVNICYTLLSTFSEKDCKMLVDNASKMGPIGGIFDLAEFEQTDIALGYRNADGVFWTADKKTEFIKNIDTVTRGIEYKIDHFVSFSSYIPSGKVVEDHKHAHLAGVIRDIIARRKADGYAGMVIEWGKIGQGNYIERRAITSRKDVPQSASSAIRVLDQVLQLSHSVVTSFVWDKLDKLKQISKTDAVLQGVARFLGMKDPSVVGSIVTMLDLGLDSLIATDIQNFLEHHCGLALSTQEIRELTFEKLKNLVSNLV